MGFRDLHGHDLFFVECSELSRDLRKDMRLFLSVPQEENRAMDIEVFVICDAATDSAGKLNVLGAFDSLLARSVPVVHPQCTVALRMRFARIEEGDHKIKISLVDADGRPVVPDLDAGMHIRFHGAESSLAANMVMNLQRVQFKTAGEYSINLAVDGRFERAIPFAVRLIQPEASQKQN